MESKYADGSGGENMPLLKISKFYKIQKSYFIIMILIILIAFPITAYADMGPKPQITIHVINPPEEEYYLDLLVKDESNYNNIKWDRASYDQTKLALLELVNIDGWHPGLIQGTGIPLHGKLTGVKEAEQMVHIFSYI